MHDFLHADGRYEDGAAVRGAEERDGHVAPCGLDEHPWSQAVAVEGGDVGSVGGFATCCAEDVEEIWLRDGGTGGGFPLWGLGGVFWFAEAAVDFSLVLHVGVGVGVVRGCGFVFGHG